MLSGKGAGPNTGVGFLLRPHSQITVKKEREKKKREREREEGKKRGEKRTVRKEEGEKEGMKERIMTNQHPTLWHPSCVSGGTAA